MSQPFAIPIKSVPGKLSISQDRGWVRVTRYILLLGFLATPAFILLVPIGRRLFWTVMIAVLPLLFTAAGFHFWRRICPLALFGQLGRLIERPGKRRASSWLSKNYLLVQFGILIFALSLRLIATNGTPWALAGFLIAIALAAAVTSLIYTGKTWCNYLCPVSVVEKLYTEPVRLAGQGNSQCATCTACKSNCPDIDVESAYWKEIAQPARRWVYFSWPGIVLGFYAYFYLVSGGWNYYFSGDWTRETEQLLLALNDGFVFAPWVPRLIAAPLTLLLLGSASYCLFLMTERHLNQKTMDATHLRHRLFALAGFSGFLFFYTFAGQPTLLQMPWSVQRIFEAVVVFVSAAIFFRRWNRSEEDHVREKLHRRIAAHPEARHDAYRDALKDFLADGRLSKLEQAILVRLRRELAISEKEHERAMLELASSGRLVSQEERLQQQQYRRDLERLVLIHAEQGQSVDAGALERLRAEYSIPPDKHARTLAELGGVDGRVADILREASAACEQLRRARRYARQVTEASSDTLAFFEYVTQWRLRHHEEKAQALSSVVQDQALGSVLTAEPIPDPGTDLIALLAVARDPSPYVRAATLNVLRHVAEESAQAAVHAARIDSDPLVREDTAGDGLSTLQKMIMLRKIPLFATLDPDDLVHIPEAAQEQVFATGISLCREGEHSDEVFVIVNGRVEVTLGAGETLRKLGEAQSGDCIGEMAALDQVPRSATVTAVVDTHALVLEGKRFRELLLRHPVISQAMLGVLSRRLRESIVLSGSGRRSTTTE